ncbi:MAG: hypothetical protein KF708_01875 [Pirellulales bacterium]|nr:hypothetical protein [Pirellulales bacterium]
MRSFGLACAALALLTLVGCGSSGPPKAPLGAPKKPVQKLPADEAGAEVEAVAVEVEVEEEMPAEGASKEKPAEESTAAAEAKDESTPDEPAPPQQPRPSVFLKLLAQPAQDAVQGNIETLTSGAGGLLPSP